MIDMTEALEQLHYIAIGMAATIFAGIVSWAVSMVIQLILEVIRINR